MYNPYIQVMRTYLQHHPFLSVKQSLLISGILFFNAFLFFQSGMILQFYLFLFIALFAYWIIHVKEQFAAPRASLKPGFRKVHGVVATIAAIVFVILLPGVIALLIGMQPIGLVSITTLLFGIILWAVLRLGRASIPLIIVGCIFTLLEPIRNGIEKIVSGNEPVQALIIISIGAILSITGIIRLFLLNEEKPEYHLNFKSPIDDSRGWRRWFTNRRVVRMIYHAQHATDSYWSRMHRWNVSNRIVWLILFFTISAKLFFTLNGHFNDTINFNIATMLPILLVLIRKYQEKIRFIAQDLMMPVRRDSYLKELGISIAFTQFIAWAMAIAASIVWIFIAAAKPNPDFFIYSITYSLMIQIWGFGVFVWVCSSRITLGLLIFFIAAVLPLYFMLPFNANAQIMIIPRWPLIPGAILACLGLLLTWRGYRSLLVADFDPRQKDERWERPYSNKRNII
jgi:hypothetical protein